MLTGTIRPIETQTVDVEGHSLDEIRAALQARTPVGFELTAAPVRMVKGSTRLTATGTFARRDGLRTIEAPDFAGLRARVPDGFQLLTARR